MEPRLSLRMKALALLAVVSTGLLAGCANVGDTNPTSPQKMEEIRQKQDQERANPRPADAGSPGVGGR